MNGAVAFVCATRFIGFGAAQGDKEDRVIKLLSMPIADNSQS
jgi:hypothetical protein